MTGLPFGPLDAETWHVCIDMQRLFLEPGEWHCPAGLKILSSVAALCVHAPERSLFSRFITARAPDDAAGRWRNYYRRWTSVTRDVIGEGAMELHELLRPLAPPDRVFDKLGHDCFGSAAFAGFVAAARPGALVLSGIETDVCVLATAMTAVDLGIRVVIATDAVASSSEASHRACLELVYPRFDQQIELAGTAAVLDAWTP